MNTNTKRDTNSPRDHPKNTSVHIIRSEYYSVRYISDDIADVFLFPEGRVYDIGDGQREYDTNAFVVRGVHVWHGLESYIRANYDMMCAIGVPFI